MNWGKTKVIFIICFLLLDLFLGYQLYHRQKQNLNFGPLASNSADIKSKVKIETPLPKVDKNASFLKGKQMVLADDSGKLIDALKKLEGTKKHKVQTIEAFDNGVVIEGTFKEPISIPEKAATQKAALQKYIFKGDEYQYWKTIKNGRTMVFVQTFKGNPVFIKDRSGVSSLQLVIDNGKVTGYRQSYLEFDKTNELDTMSPMTAINNLLDQNDLPIGLHPVIKGVELSYLNLIGDANLNKLLVFVPSWHVTVETDKGLNEFFVNAASGSIQTIDGTGVTK